MRVYYDRDADVNLIKGKRVAIIGYGSQGHAHANNLKDSGAKNVAVGLRPSSGGVKKAETAGLRVMDPADCAKWADVVMVLTPDEGQGDLYRDKLGPNMKAGAALAFAHGLNIHFNLIEPRSDIDVFMIAPKGPGHTVRSEYQRGGGVPASLRCRRIRPAMRSKSRCPTRRQSAVVVPGSSKPRSRKNAKPTCSASRSCCAAVWWS